MKRKITLAFVCLLISFLPFVVTSQTLKFSDEFQQAIAKGTRTGKGLPGKNYWINHTDYDLKVQVKFVNDDIWIIGSGKMTYYNASPDTLNEIVLHSYPDFYVKGATRDFTIGSENEVEPVEYSNIMVNGISIPADEINERNPSTIICLKSNPPIEPGEKATINICWKYRLNPNMNLRQGIYKDTSIFVAYWYPQVSVYDDLDGWDKLEYTGLTEFYSDFNNYNITLTIPAGYYVWASGVLQNAGEVYTQSVLQKYNAALNGFDNVQILSEEDLSMRALHETDKTWHFTSEHVPDFTFAASRTHIWDAKTISFENGKKVFVSSVYAPKSFIYRNNINWACDAIEYLSEECPGVTFPYTRMTVFNNMDLEEGAMESPMMVNSGDQQTNDLAREVTFHEIAHTYQPFLLGTNERRYAWMDEGWATYQGIKWSKGRSGTIIDMFRDLFNQLDSNSMKCPLMTPSYKIGGYAEETFHAYIKSFQVLYALENQLGTKKMNQGWKLFTEKWSGKHASPWDFFAIFNKVASENMDWLIEPWFYADAFPDLAIEKLDTVNETLTITNNGGLPLPVYLNIKYSDSNNLNLFYKPEVFRYTNQHVVKLKKAAEIELIELGNQFIFDKNTTNNTWKKN